MKKGLIKTTLIVLVVNFLCKLIAFYRDVLIANRFGATEITDAFNISQTIPNMFYALISVAITTTFIPLLNKVEQKNEENLVNEFYNKLINNTIIVSGIIVIILYIFCNSIVKIIAPTYSGYLYAITVNLTRVSVFNIIFLSITSVYSAILNSRQKFVLSTFSTLISVIPSIIYILFYHDNTIKGLIISVLIGFIAQSILNVIGLMKEKYTYKFIIDFKDKEIKEMGVLMLPVLLGTGINQLNQLVTKIMASSLEAGSITALEYASKLNTMIHSIFAISIVTIFYPILSKSISKKNINEFNYSFNQALTALNIVMIPSAIGIICLRVPIIEILFKRGAFDENAVNMTAIALLFLSPSMIFYGIRDIINRVFYSIEDTNTPMKNGLISVGICIILNITLATKLGIIGLALATTISSFISVLLLSISLKRKVNYLYVKESIINAIKIAISSSIMGIMLIILRGVIAFNSMLLNTIIIVILGIIIYIISILKLKVININQVIDIVKKDTSKRAMSLR